MKKVLLIFALLLFLFSACQEKPGITEPTQDEPNPYGFGYGSYQKYLFGECDDNGDFIFAPKTVTLAYKGVLNINGVPCNQFELYSDSIKEVGFIAMTDKWIKLFSGTYAPFLHSSILEENTPLVWQTFWTRDYTESSFDTVTKGKHPLLIEIDSMFRVTFVDCEYHFKYKFEDIGEGGWTPPGSCAAPVKTRGTKISFVTIAKLTDKKGHKFPRFALEYFKDWAYDEFYFDNDRSSYIDKVEMKVFVGEKVGITSIWIKHKTIFGVRTYIYKLKLNYSIKFG